MPGIGHNIFSNFEQIVDKKLKVESLILKIFKFWLFRKRTITIE